MRDDFARMMRKGSGGYEEVLVRPIIIKDDDGVTVRARAITKSWRRYRRWNWALVSRFLASRVGQTRKAIEREIARTIPAGLDRDQFRDMAAFMIFDPRYPRIRTDYRYDAQGRLVPIPRARIAHQISEAVRAADPTRIDLDVKRSLTLTAGGWQREVRDPPAASFDPFAAAPRLAPARKPLRRREWEELELDRYHKNAVAMKDAFAAGRAIESYLDVHNAILAALPRKLKALGYGEGRFNR